MVPSNIVEISMIRNGMTVGKRAQEAVNIPLIRKSRAPRNGKSTVPKISLGLLAVVIFFSISSKLPFVGIQDAVYKKMDEMMLIPRQNPYTSLYFEYYDDLPTKVAAGETVNFSFTIKNEEGTDKVYTYNVYFNNGENRKRIPVDKGTISLKDGESKTINEQYEFTQDHKKEILYVEIPETGQKIHFILTSQ